MIPGRGDPLQNSFSSFARKHQSTINNKAHHSPTPINDEKNTSILFFLQYAMADSTKESTLKANGCPMLYSGCALEKKNREIAISTALGSTSRSKPLQFGVGLDAPKSCNKGSSLSSLLLGNANLLVFLINQLQSQVSRI